MKRESKSAFEVAQMYFDAWNRHDLSAILALFGESGTFLAPSLPRPIGAAEIRRLFDYC